MQIFDNLDIKPEVCIRYDQVVHLVSAAIGAEEHYTRLDSNLNKTDTDFYQEQQQNPD